MEVDYKDVTGWLNRYRSECGEDPFDDGTTLYGEEVIFRDYLVKNYPKMFENPDYEKLKSSSLEDLPDIIDILGEFAEWLVEEAGFSWEDDYKNTLAKYDETSLKAEEEYAKAMVEAGKGEDLIDSLKSEIEEYLNN